MLRSEADGLMRRERPNLNVEIHLVSVAAIPGERFSRPRSGVSKIERNFRAIHCFLVLVRSQRWLAAKKKKDKGKVQRSVEGQDSHELEGKCG